MHMILIKKDSGYRIFTIEIFNSAKEAENYADRCNHKRKKYDLKVVIFENSQNDFRKIILFDKYIFPMVHKYCISTLEKVSFYSNLRIPIEIKC